MSHKQGKRFWSREWGCGVTIESKELWRAGYGPDSSQQVQQAAKMTHVAKARSLEHETKRQESFMNGSCCLRSRSDVVP